MTIVIKRIAAVIIDWMIFSIFSAIAALPFGFLFAAFDNESILNLSLRISYGIVLTYLLYGRERQEIGPGRRLLKLNLIDDETLLKPNKLKAFVRAVMIYVFPIDILFAFFTAGNRSISDIITRTHDIEIEEQNEKDF